MPAREVDIAGAAHTVLGHRTVRHLDPLEGLFAAMLEGWDRRLLCSGTRSQRADVVRRFIAFTGSWPWQWAPSDVEDWTAHLRSDSKPRAHSTIRGYHNSVALFLSYVTDQRYGWATRCEDLTGTHPVQVFHEWNTARHTSETESRPEVRPFTRDELQEFFDFADEQVARARTLGRKGWVAAFRDATLFKVAYAWGLRRREVHQRDTSSCIQMRARRDAAVPVVVAVDRLEMPAQLHGDLELGVIEKHGRRAGVALLVVVVLAHWCSFARSAGLAASPNSGNRAPVSSTERSQSLRATLRLAASGVRGDRATGPRTPKSRVGPR